MKFLELKQVKKRMNTDFILEIDNVIFQNQINGIVGNNGSGKTTLFSLICFIRKLDYGQIIYNNTVITTKNLESWKYKFSAYLDNSFMFDYYTAKEFINFVLNAYNIEYLEQKKVIEEYIDKLYLSQYLDLQISSLSYGNKKKVGLLASLISKPEVLIWDEPFSGLDPKSQENVKKIIIDYYSNSNSIILISSHDLHHVAEISSNIFIMSEGKFKEETQKEMNYEELRKSLLT